MLREYVDVVVMAVAVCEVVRHVVWSCEVEGNVRVGNLVVGVSDDLLSWCWVLGGPRGPLLSRGLFRSRVDGIEDDLDCVLNAVVVAAVDPVMSLVIWMLWFRLSSPMRRVRTVRSTLVL